MSDATGTGAQMSHPAVPVLLGLLIMAGGGYLYYTGMQASANAQPVDATVVDSSVVDERDAGDDDGPDYTISIEYRYTYEGTAYTSSNLCPSAGTACAPASDVPGEMEDYLEDYRDGDAVTAYVPPSDPDGAFLLQSGPSGSYLIVVGFGAVVLLLGIHRIVTG